MESHSSWWPLYIHEAALVKAWPCSIRRCWILLPLGQWQWIGQGLTFDLCWFSQDGQASLTVCVRDVIFPTYNQKMTAIVCWSWMILKSFITKSLKGNLAVTLAENWCGHKRTSLLAHSLETSCWKLGGIIARQEGCVVLSNEYI